MTTPTFTPFSVNDMLGLQEPIAGDETEMAFGAVTFGSSDGFEGENDGAPPMLSAETISFRSELAMCVAFTPLPKAAVIFTLVGFDVPPELEPPDELPPELLLGDPLPHSCSKESAERSFVHDAFSTQASSFVVGEPPQNDAQASAASAGGTLQPASLSSHLAAHVDVSATGADEPDDELDEDEPPRDEALSVVVVQASAASVKKDPNKGTARRRFMPRIPARTSDPSILPSAQRRFPTTDRT